LPELQIASLHCCELMWHRKLAVKVQLMFTFPTLRKHHSEGHKNICSIFGIPTSTVCTNR